MRPRTASCYRGEKCGDIQSRQDIEVLVSAFYRDIRSDEMLGSLFDRQIGSNWAGHEARVCDFWENVLLGGTRFKSRSLRHLDVDQVCPLCPFHFDRWCLLFERSVRSHFEGEQAQRAICRAMAMSQALQNQLEKERGCPFANLT